MEFSDWVTQELEMRGWSRSEAARRGHISASMFDKVINGYAKPGIKFCQGLSQALNIPLVEVLRRAGLESSVSADKGKEITELIEKLTEENQNHIIQQIQILLEMQQRQSNKR